MDSTIQLKLDYFDMLFAVEEFFFGDLWTEEISNRDFFLVSFVSTFCTDLMVNNKYIRIGTHKCHKCHPRIKIRQYYSKFLGISARYCFSLCPWKWNRQPPLKKAGYSNCWNMDLFWVFRLHLSGFIFVCLTIDQ